MTMTTAFPSTTLFTVLSVRLNFLHLEWTSFRNCKKFDCFVTGTGLLSRLLLVFFLTFFDSLVLLFLRLSLMWDDVWCKGSVVLSSCCVCIFLLSVCLLAKRFLPFSSSSSWSFTCRKWPWMVSSFNILLWIDCLTALKLFLATPMKGRFAQFYKNRC